MAIQLCSPVLSTWSDLLVLLRRILAPLHSTAAALYSAAHTLGTYTCPYLIEHDADYKEPVRSFIATTISAAVLWGIFCFDILPNAEKRRAIINVFRQMGGIVVLVLQALHGAEKRVFRRLVGGVAAWCRKYFSSFLLLAAVYGFSRLVLYRLSLEKEAPLPPVHWREVYHLMDVRKTMGAYSLPRPCRPIFHVDIDDVWTPLGDICYH